MLDTIIKYKLADVKVDNIILNIQNIALFGISLSALYCCINYAISGQSIFTPPIVSDILNDYHGTTPSFVKPFYNLLYFVQIHVVFDIFFVKSTDVFLHHLCVIGMSFYGRYNNITPVNGFLFSFSLLKTEVSSIFLVLKYWIPENTIAYTINGLLLYTSFFKFRIVDGYNEMFKGNYAFDELINKYTPTNPVLSGVLYVSIYGLYILNLYWFLIMTKVLYKTIFKNTFINTEKMCQYICSYIYYLNIPLAVYMYSYKKQEHYIFDMIGIVMLSVASYMFHYDIYKKITMKRIENYVLEENMNYVYFLNDCICIHIRSFLALVTNYYTTSYFYPVVTVCGIFQIGCIYSSIMNVIDLLSNRTYKKSDFLKIHYVFTFLPVGIDILMTFIETKSMEISVPFFIINIIVVLLFVVDPFYKLTHVAFHIMMLVHTYYVCLANGA